MKNRNRLWGILVIVAAGLLVFYLVWGLFLRTDEQSGTETEEEESVETDWDDAFATDILSDVPETDPAEGEDEEIRDDMSFEDDYLDESALDLWEYVEPEITSEDFRIIGLEEDVAALIDVDGLSTAIQEQLYREGFDGFTSATVREVEMTDNSIVISMLVRCNKLVDIDMTTYFDGEWNLKIWSVEEN